ncbi:o-succinylbenzoate synthase [Pricia sp. S334]|uniref:O-succinylbenzoate synthase n=1 Tax=Pricia mediterranea TaxID=3076079 RepID=A0ABU3LA15_9FLAO|nr:o-succinylbenzoate synthase [Pricia sp. S334]MDT7830146.1 o-succinylbenzoate synthase [Pricia sp. S334]
MEARFRKYVLDFKRPSGTSRGVMRHKETWFLILEENGRLGIGECGLLRGLSCDDIDGYEEKLAWTCANIHLGREALWEALTDYPSIQFGMEQAFLSLTSKTPFELFPSQFTRKERPIPINGLVWMGDEGFMHEQIEQKLAQGFRCIKMKIGAIDFNKEVALLASIRKRYTEGHIELRVDANGAFEVSQALKKLQVLAAYDLHSIEQPIPQGNPQAMKKLCEVSPIPIALDEELIGVKSITDKQELLETIRPQYIILKPSLIGGYQGSGAWIDLAEKFNIAWWVTSALESNIGLNAIAQWTYTLDNTMPQGLGTGSLYTNNFESPLEVQNGKIYYRSGASWQSDLIQKLCT